MYLFGIVSLSKMVKCYFPNLHRFVIFVDVTFFKSSWFFSSESMDVTSVLLKTFCLARSSLRIQWI